MRREITPLTQNDCFTIFSRVKKDFNFPLHFHEEYELNLIINAAGAMRMVGDHEEMIDEIELVLIGPNLPHTWLTHACRSEAITEITLQWNEDLFSDRILRKNQLSAIRLMFDQAKGGLLFSAATAAILSSRIIGLKDKQGFEAVIELMVILHELSESTEHRVLSLTSAEDDQVIVHNSRRIDKVVDYLNIHFQKNITLLEVSKLVNMTEVSFSRFIKQRTGITFIDTLNQIRLSHASRMLIETSDSIADIAVDCGFNNISNFNRVFKHKKHCTPKEFRDNFIGTKVFI